MNYNSALQSRGMQLSGAGSCHISCRKVNGLTAPSCIMQQLKKGFTSFFLSRAHDTKRQTSCLYIVPQKQFSTLSFLANPISPLNAHRGRVGVVQTLPCSLSFPQSASHVASRTSKLFRCHVSLQPPSLRHLEGLARWEECDLGLWRSRGAARGLVNRGTLRTEHHSFVMRRDCPAEGSQCIPSTAGRQL